MDDEHSWSIHDLDNAPEPPANALMDGSGSGLGISPPRMMTTTTAFSTSKTRRHSADSMEPSSPQQQQQQSSQRPKSISLRDRTWSAPSHPLYPTSASNYYNARAAEMASSASYASASQLSPLVARRQTSLPDHRRRSNTVEELGTPSPVLPPKRWSSSGGSSRLDRMMSMHQQGHLSLPVLGDTEFLAMADDGGGVKPHGGESSEGNYNDDDYGKYYGYGDGPAATVTNLEAMQWLGDVAGGGGSGGGRMPDLGSSLASQKGGSDSMIEPNPGITAHQLPPSVSVLAGVGSIATMTRVHQSQESDPVHKQKLRSNTRREQPHEGHYPLEDQLEDSSHNNIDNNNNLDDDEDEDENDFSHSSSVWGEAGSSSPLHEYKRWKIPTLHQIAVCVAMRVYAPCIWIWYGMSWMVGCPKPSVLSVRRPTDRAILARLNILVGVLALFQIAAALGFLILIAAPNLADRTIPTQTESESQAQQTRSRSSSSIWNVTLNLYLIGVEAFVLVVAAALTVRVVRNVNLVGAIRYLWVLLYVSILSRFGDFCVWFSFGGLWLRCFSGISGILGV